MSHPSAIDPIDQEAERVAAEQVMWWVARDWEPAEAAKALGLPRHLSWADLQRKMRMQWLELNGI